MIPDLLALKIQQVASSRNQKKASVTMTWEVERGHILQGLADHILIFLERGMGSKQAGTQDMLYLNRKPLEVFKQGCDMITSVFSERSHWQKGEEQMRKSRIASGGTSKASTMTLATDNGSVANGSGSRKDKFQTDTRDIQKVEPSGLPTGLDMMGKDNRGIKDASLAEQLDGCDVISRQATLEKEDFGVVLDIQ